MLTSSITLMKRTIIFHGSPITSTENQSCRKIWARSLGSKECMQEYADFTVDSRPPVFRNPEFQTYRQMSFDDYNREHIEKHGELKRQVRRYSGKQISYKGVCPSCGAGSQYLYDNNGKGRQFRCKVCSTTFTENVTRSDEVGCYCPYCNTKMMQGHDRSNYIVYRCENRNFSTITTASSSSPLRR